MSACENTTNRQGIYHCEYGGLPKKLSVSYNYRWGPGIGTYLGDGRAEIDDTNLGALQMVSTTSPQAGLPVHTRSTLSPKGTVLVTTKADRTLPFSVSIAFPERIPWVTRARTSLAPCSLSTEAALTRVPQVSAISSYKLSQRQPSRYPPEALAYCDRQVTRVSSITG